MLVSLKDGQKVIVTHVVEFVIEEQNSLKYITRGINNEVSDETIVNHREIIGEYKGFRVSMFGYMIGFSRTNVGYWVIVVLPLG